MAYAVAGQHPTTNVLVITREKRVVVFHATRRSLPAGVVGFPSSMCSPLPALNWSTPDLGGEAHDMTSGPRTLI